MSIKLEIHPSSSSLDLLGPPDTSSAYSLSGHISLSLACCSSYSLFERQRAVRILLRSLVITFEGQAELITQEATYSAIRLCTISKELVSKTTIELSNDGHEDREGPSVWHIMFDLPIPGWLPASDLYGDCRQGISGTQYNLYASARFSSVDSLGPSWVSALCPPFFPRNNVLHAEHRKIMLNRFSFPAHKPAYYSVSLTAGGLSPKDNPHPVPADIISKVELLASVPDGISLDQEKFPFSLSIRTSSLSESQAAKLHIAQFSLELHQNDQYSSAANAYAARYPVPSQKNQPPTKCLREAHPLHSLYDIGLLGSPGSFTVDDTHSLLPGYDRIDIPLDTADYSSKCARGMHPARWLTMETKVPFTRSLFRSKEGTLDWTGSPHLRETSQGPFFSVSHTLRVIVTITYDDEGDNDNDNGKNPPTSFLAFVLPLNFIRLRPAARTASPQPESRVPSSDAPATLPTTMPPSQTYGVPELPAYSQLFYPNGDVRYDDSIPLPRYTPPSPSDPLPT